MTYPKLVTEEIDKIIMENQELSAPKIVSQFGLKVCSVTIARRRNAIGYPWTRKRGNKLGTRINRTSPPVTGHSYRPQPDYPGPEGWTVSSGRPCPQCGFHEQKFAGNSEHPTLRVECQKCQARIAWDEFNSGSVRTRRDYAFLDGFFDSIINYVVL